MITEKKFNCAKLGKKTVLVTEDTEEHPGYSSTLEVSMKQSIFLYIFGMVDNCIWNKIYPTLAPGEFSLTIFFFVENVVVIHRGE